MHIERLQLGPMANFVYLLHADQAPGLVVVDPAWQPEALLARAEQLQLPITDIVLTHHHADHRNGVEALLAQGDVRVHVQASERAWLDSLGWHGHVTWHHSGDVLQVGRDTLTLVHTPGHTPGSQCILAGDAILTGDTLFIDGCGRCDLPGGDPQVLFHSLHRTLGAVPAQTRVLPGHDYAPQPEATLDEQRVQNPYLRLHNMADFVAYRMRPRK